MNEPMGARAADEGEEEPELIDLPPWRWNHPVAMQRATMATIYARQRASESARSKEMRLMVMDTLRRSWTPGLPWAAMDTPLPRKEAIEGFYLQGALETNRISS